MYPIRTTGPQGPFVFSGDEAVKQKSNKSGSKAGAGMAKSMVQIPLYRPRIEKNAQDAACKRPSKNSLLKAIDDGGLR